MIIYIILMEYPTNTEKCLHPLSQERSEIKTLQNDISIIMLPSEKGNATSTMGYAEKRASMIVVDIYSKMTMDTS